MLIYISVFLTSLLICFLITPVIINIAKRYNIVDKPDIRKIHKEPIPRIGGLAIIISIIFTSFFYLTTLYIFDPNFLVLKYFKYKFTQILGLVISFLVILITGILDDIKDLSAKKKLIIQLLVGNILFFTGTKVDFFIFPSDTILNNIINYIFTVLWVVGLMNAINLLDGLDGLLSGVSFIISITLGVLAIAKGQTVLAIIIFSLSGALLGFLRYNFNPAKIFLGDTGSLFIGLFMSVISILGYFKKATFISFVIPILIFALPILDTILAIIRRALKKQPIFKPDKEHLHHLLLKSGLSQKQTVTIFYIITLLLSILVISIAK
ncbi:MAG: undecaprenyl/decaprenyl-phosphate alpha-N-acetylglucosaminyl 1-phosphate transferase [bacterium]|nr:undecaprenyl/decaprenyl-phosphate alpha-N-acetylglucosaminyl 1-phosphate transferase [bacterium]